LREPVTLQIHVRYYGGAYIARCNGKTASSTNSRKWAAIRAALKAADVLQTLGIIGEVPDEDGITVRQRSGALWEATL
jgi:hypothetical protein